MGRNSIGFVQWMNLDIEYVEKRNLKLDMILILKTVKVFFGDNTAS